MQEAIPYRRITNNGGGGAAAGGGGSRVKGMRSLVSETPVVVLGRRGCCMCHVVKRLLLGLGVNPAVCEMDDDGEEAAAVEEMAAAAPPGGSRPPPPQFPAVFIGGRHVGGLDRLMAAHIAGDLVPILKDAGALWL